MFRLVVTFLPVFAVGCPGSQVELGFGQHGPRLPVELHGFLFSVAPCNDIVNIQVTTYVVRSVCVVLQ